MAIAEELRDALPKGTELEQCAVLPYYKLRRLHRIEQTTAVPADIDDDAQVVITGWMACWGGSPYHDGMATGANNGKAAAQVLFDQEYLSDEHGTVRLEVCVWRQVIALDKDNEPAELIIDGDTHVFTRELPPPTCEDGKEHDWHAPHEIVGGLEDTPGVYGHGGGVICTEICRHCWLHKITDTWTHDDIMDTHYTSVSYQAAPHDE